MLLSDNSRALINSLTIAQIDALIQEEELKKAGYKFKYICDADDVKSYCHPLGIYGRRAEERGLSIEYITDEQIALYSLFKANSFQAIVLSSHEDEVIDYVKAVEFLERRGSHIIKTSKFLEGKLKEKYENLSLFSKDINKVRGNISLILSIAVGLEAEGVKKLNKLITERKILLREERLQELEGFEYLNLVFSEAKKTILTDKVFDFFVTRYGKKEPDDLTGFSSQKNWDTLRSRLASHRDAIVIDRLFSINKILSEEKRKVVFLYISSDVKTTDIFYENTHILRNEFIPIGERRFNYLRNSTQIFIRMLCEADSPDKTIENYKKFRVLLEVGRDSKSQSEESDAFEEVKRQIEERIDYYRRNFEDFATLNKIDEFKGLTKIVNSNSDEFQIIDIINTLINSREQHLEEWDREAANNLSNLKQMIVFRPRIYQLLDNVIMITKVNSIQGIDTGEDFVVGMDHHLPTLFDSSNETASPTFMDFIDHYHDSEDSLRNFVSEKALSLFKEKTTMEEELTLKRCLLLLILSESEQSRKTNSQHCEYFLVNFIWSAQKVNADYLLCWVYRRNEKYDEALAVSRRVIKEGLKDPRFYHASALALYCKYEKYKNITYIRESLSDVEQALKLYEEWVIDDEKKKILLRNNIYALLNTRVYELCLLYDKEGLKNQALIDNARSQLFTLKRRCKDEADEKYYYSKPEFLHTEAYLELLEYRNTGNLEKLERAYDAVSFAGSKARYKKLRDACHDLKEAILTYKRLEAEKGTPD